MKTNSIHEKCKAFAIEIVNLNKELKQAREHVLSNQILRSGTSIGANYFESQGAEGTADFIHKVSIAYKETLETDFWLQILLETQFIEELKYHKLNNQLQELRRILAATLISAKAKLRNSSSKLAKP